MRGETSRWQRGHPVSKLVGGAVLAGHGARDLKDLSHAGPVGSEIIAEFCTATQVADFEAAMLLIYAVGSDFREQTGARRFAKQEGNRLAQFGLITFSNHEIVAVLLQDGATPAGLGMQGISTDHTAL